MLSKRGMKPNRDHDDREMEKPKRNGRKACSLKEGGGNQTGITERDQDDRTMETPDQNGRKPSSLKEE